MIIAAFGCGPKPIVDKDVLNIGTLPEYKPCSKITKIYDPDKPYRRLGNYSNLSYAYSYNAISIRGDSLEREKIRRVNADLAQALVKTNFPDIEVVDGSQLAAKNYVDIFLPEARIYSLMDHLTVGSEDITDSAAVERAEASIDDLTVDSEANLQLFLTVRTYLYGKEMRSILRVYIFNKSEKRIDYYDSLEYKCDIRDKDALVKTLNYALEKINSTR